MIKKTYLILFICLFVWSCDDPKNESPQLQENEKLLRSITKTNFNVVEQFGEPSTFFNYQELQIFDKNGNLTEIAYYDSLGNPSTAYSGKVHKEKFVYNADNKEVRSSRFDINGDYVSEYNAWVTIVTKYDSLGNESERIGYNKWEDIDFIVKYKTDINGVEEAIQYDKDNNVESESYTKFDLNGNIIQSIRYGAFGKRANRLENNYVYNSDNNQIQMTTDCNYNCFEQEYFGKEQNFFYDEKGNLVEETYVYPDDPFFEDVRFRAKKVYSYDNQKRLIEELSFDRNNEPIKGRTNISRTTYEYFDNNSYEVIHYFLTEKFGEPEYGIYWKELIQEEFYE